MKRFAFILLVLALLTALLLLQGGSNEQKAQTFAAASAEQPQPVSAAAPSAGLLNPAELIRAEADLAARAPSEDLLEFFYAGSPELPASGAIVTIISMKESTETEHRADVEGSLRFLLPRGTCLVRASGVFSGTSLDYSATELIEVGEHALTQRIVLHPAKVGELEILVLGRAGAVPDVSVSLSDGQSLAQARSDERGRCRFPLEAGRGAYFFVGELAAPRARRAVTEEELARGLAVAQLLDATLTLELADPFGLEAPVFVSLEVPPDFDKNQHRFWYAKGGDRIEVENLKPGRYRLEAALSDPSRRTPDGIPYAPLTRDLLMGEDDLNFICRLEPAPMLDLMVEDAEGNPVQGAAVFIEHTASGIVNSTTPTTWSLGKNASIRIPTGEVTLRVSAHQQGYGELFLNALPGEQLTRTLRLSPTAARLFFDVATADAERLARLSVYRTDGELIREHDNRIRVRMNFGFTGVNGELIEPQKPEHKLIDLGYYEGGPTRLVIVLQDGTRTEMAHHPSGDLPFRIPLP